VWWKSLKQEVIGKQRLLVQTSHVRCQHFDQEPGGGQIQEGTMSGVSEMISVKQQSNACSNVEDKPELQLLDLYCGCGAMSTGLCLGANLAGANLVTVLNFK
jgi:hypothetical protein